MIPDHRVTRDRNFDILGHVTAAVSGGAGVPTDVDFYPCDPGQFMHDSAAALTARGVASDRVSTEVFGPSNSELATASATDQASGAGGADDSFATRAIVSARTRFHFRTRLCAQPRAVSLCAEADV